LTTCGLNWQVDELKIDVDKQLAADATTVTDFEQLDWLRKADESWNTQEGRVIYFHHPPYVTEATKWQQADGTRRRLRQVPDAFRQLVHFLRVVQSI